MSVKRRIAVALLSMSAVGFATWQAHEGFTAVAVIPTKGDVPTIGHGSTRYEDGRPVRMGDKITRKRAEELARNLNRAEERAFAKALPGVTMTQGEFDAYMDFVGQYGMGNFRGSSMQRNLMAGRYEAACTSMLKYKFAAGFDCSTPGNKRCSGVWTRQQKRVASCLEALK